MKDKTCSVDALAVFVKETVIPTGERIRTLRGDRVTELTSAEFASTVKTSASSWTLPL